MTIKFPVYNSRKIHLTFLSSQGGLLNTGHTKVEGLSLQLENVGRTDAGIYICTANNGVGESASAQITVNINCKYLGTSDQ